ncbi:MAG: holo-ACP synthase [Clostridiaceae bacterium]|nr:holo-ACP synthase [Clostridiaceae bacterium]
MNIYCGVDMIEIKRIKDSIEKHGKGFIEKIFTPEEINYCESRREQKYQSYAARFSAKEAVSKALGTGFSMGVTLKGIEVRVSETGKPYIVLYNETKEFFDKMGGVSVDISLTHTSDYATAFAVLLCK